ncbi:MAG TPA: thrombospondin type 3 repeat-containing protein [Candidatus Limnocylindrales bacterium]|nr:thrombospondin type 3 repeat-containing protein [Candidatus Limnocylindrales bacterium]
MNEKPALRWLRAFILAPLSTKKASVAPLACLLLVSQASAAPFSFSTGDPDGKIATLSRPSSPGKMQTETADDFLLTNSVVINEATFTGLLPLGTALTSISNVEIEIYHVFPGDTAFPLSGNVPTRTNSPADIEIDSATRDSANGSMTFSATMVSASFTASNSVVNGINKSPAQRTNGEGEVTGEEVLITVHFNPPIALPADHYFFRPEVLLDRGDFLWLSAPRPIVAPGTPFGTDLQSWIRNDALAPDWLRIGTDITGQGPFNAAFSLSGETDADADGVADSLDQCPNTAPGAIVDAQGCSIDQIAPCSGPASGGTWKNHGQYVSSVAQAAEAFQAQGLINAEQAEEIIAQAAQSNCGAKGQTRTKHLAR